MVFNILVLLRLLVFFYIFNAIEQETFGPTMVFNNNVKYISWFVCLAYYAKWHKVAGEYEYDEA